MDCPDRWLWAISDQLPNQLSQLHDPCASNGDNRAVKDRNEGPEEERCYTVAATEIRSSETNRCSAEPDNAEDVQNRRDA